jgi:hypothetical protein
VVEHGSWEQTLDQRWARRRPETLWCPVEPAERFDLEEEPTVVDQGATLDAVPRDVSSIAFVHASVAASRRSSPRSGLGTGVPASS